MVTSRPLAPDMLPYPAPERYPGMPVGGVLRTDQSIFLGEVARDPAALGFEGAPDEIDRLRVAAVYVQEENTAEGLHPAQEGRGPGAAYGPYGRRVTNETIGWLNSHCDTRQTMARLRASARRADKPFNAILQAQIWSHSAGDTPAGRAMRHILAEHDRKLYRPVIRRVQERAVDISAEDAAREIKAELPAASASLLHMSTEAGSDAVLTALRAAQRAFRRAGTTELGIDELERRLGTPDGFATSMVVHALAGMGAVRRSRGGHTLHATEMLHVPQGRIAATLSAIGENVLHLTGIRRIPERARGAA